jgi:hypothetical protein
MIARVGAPLVAACALTCALAFPALAHSHDQRIKDGNDTVGALDIGATSVGHSRKSVKHTIATLGRWRTSVIRIDRSPLNYLAVGFDLKGDASFERFVIFVSVNGGQSLRAFWITPRGRILRHFRADRPNKRSVSARIPREYLTEGGGYSWAALSVFHRSGHTHIDWSPNRGTVLHDLRAPKLNVAFLHDLSTNSTAGLTFPVDFNVNDYAESAGIDWRLEGHLLDSTTWETLDSGSGVGAHTAHVVGEEGANYVIRVVARDGQGNTTMSPSWPLSFPLDDANPLFAGSYSGAWTTTSTGDPYLGTLHSSSTAGDSFTFTFTVTHPTGRVLWIGPGSGGTATLTWDGFPSPVNQNFSGDRGWVWWLDNPPLGTHTVTITNFSGTIAIDAFLIR